MNFKSVVLPELIGYAELVVDKEVLRRSWGGDRSETSVISVGELWDQFFDGAHAEDVRSEIHSLLPSDPKLGSSLVHFIDAMDETSNMADDGRFDGDASILDSAQWESLSRCASLFLQDAKEAGYSSEDFNPSGD